ncbi:dihydropteroate synthase, partial [Clavibacter michiganensis]
STRAALAVEAAWARGRAEALDAGSAGWSAAAGLSE